MGFVAVFLVFGGGAVAVYQNKQPKIPQSFEELIKLSDEEIEGFDVARMNLLCAKGLPGARDIDIEHCLSVLNQWAELVKQNEQQYAKQFFQNRHRYDNSYAKFQVVNLGLSLKDDLKCGYNQELIKSGAMEDVRSTRFFRNSSDLFLHGFIENRTGSCSSLPVLMVAIGRQCGYPLYLVTCKGHLFCRWDDGKERFNIETSCPGVDMKPDAYYMRWPHPTNEAEAKSEKFMKSLNRTEELAVFARLRATCLEENKRYAEASEAYSFALPSFPESKYLKAYLSNVNRRK